MTLASDRLPMVTAADHVPGAKQGYWTYKEYASLPNDGQRYEIIDGVLFMTPSPGRWHQKATGRLFAYLLHFVEDAGHGEVYEAPFDVELAPNVVVQPDVIVVLKDHLEKITESRIIGAPDLVVEVASPGTAHYDRREKQDTYARAGVPEYWIVDPTARTVELLVLERKAYQHRGVFQGKAHLPSTIVPDFPIHVEQLFV